jgi:hypothetical protein
MKVAIHQPHFLPWLGYLDRMIQSDAFVLLDHVQFERRNYQNRTQIRVDDEARWLTVPVVQLSQKEKIIDKRVDNPPQPAARWWGPNAFQTLRYAYRKAPYFARYAPRIQAILETRHEKLVDLNQAMLDYLRECFEIDTPLIRSSELQVAGARSQLLLNLCQAIGAKTFLGGMGGSRHYLDLEAFAAAGVGVEWQSFQHPRYAQCGSTSFIPGLTALDILFNCGPDAAGMLPRKDKRHVDECLAA